MRWDVQGRRTDRDGWQPVGQVHAPDQAMALLLARDAFFRHGEGIDLAVSHDGGTPMPLARPDLLTFATDKTYKLQRGYTGMGEKRARAVRRAARAGQTVDRPRPPDLRTHRETVGENPA